MVSSGLSARVDVAPERLMTHLGIAYLILMGLVWTAFESDQGHGRGRYVPLAWRMGAGIWAGLVYVQCLLGALVAGNDAGLVYTDWPLMNGYFAPYMDWSKGFWVLVAHDQGMVQLLHRLNAYILLTYSLVFALISTRQNKDVEINGWVRGLSLGILAQAFVGIATLHSVVNIWVALLHQFMASLLIITVTIVFWKICRADRLFR
jgi:cytochrome c oxidase assembly protein subunit 15